MWFPNNKPVTAARCDRNQQLNNNTTPAPAQRTCCNHRFPTPNAPGLRRVRTQGYGGHSVGETPGPIPNPEAKTHSADGTAPGRVWESRSPPEHHSGRGPPTTGGGPPAFNPQNTPGRSLTSGRFPGDAPSPPAGSRGTLPHLRQVPGGRSLTSGRFPGDAPAQAGIQRNPEPPANIPKRAGASRGTGPNVRERPGFPAVKSPPGRTAADLAEPAPQQGRPLSAQFGRDRRRFQ